ncbi:hypothetical protein [Streptomyces sp. NPDC059819]|uniref:hypothetical protein n=1 Tax=Streptomyces sp. NPDC059819 TaxID=3346963 RepID=UPI00365C0FC5
MRMDEWRDGWDRAGNATKSLQEAFQDAGATEVQANRLRPLVSGRGTPWVDVGMIPASLAEKLAEVIRAETAATVSAKEHVS